MLWAISSDLSWVSNSPSMGGRGQGEGQGHAEPAAHLLRDRCVVELCIPRGWLASAIYVPCMCLLIRVPPPHREAMSLRKREARDLRAFAKLDYLN